MGELKLPEEYSQYGKINYGERIEALMTRGKESEMLFYQHVEDVLVSIEDQVKKIRDTIHQEVTQNYSKFKELMLLLHEADELSQNSLIEHLEICFRNGHWIESSLNEKNLQEIKYRLAQLIGFKLNLQQIKIIGTQYGVAIPDQLPEVTNNSALKEKTIFDRFLVHVSHVRDPGEFYIVRLCDKERREAMFASLKSLAESLSCPQPIKHGQIYAVLNNGKIWCRGVCGNQCGHDQIGDNPTETLYEFFLLDQGHYEHIPSSLIRALPADLQAHPPYAIECTLNQLNPIKPWSAQATALFKKLTNRGPLDLKVFSQEGNVLNVDLAQIPCFADEGHIVSIRDALFFTQSNNPPTDIHSLLHSSERRRLPSALNIEIGSQLTGLVTQVLGPGLLYVQTDDTEEEKYQIMSQEMQDEYSNPCSEMTMTVCYPVIDEFYAARLKCIWYRVMIDVIKADGSIFAYFVDSGNCHIIQGKDLRILSDKYMVLPPQVIGCKLDGIKIPGCGKRSNFRPWPKDATDFIKQINQTQVTFFITTILKVPKARLASFAVIMYTKNSNISLNTLLCRKNYVSSISNFDIERFQHKLKVTTRQLPISKPSLPEKTTTNAALNVLASAETSTKPDEASVAVTSEFAPADSTDADVDGLTLPPSSYQSILDASLKGSYFDGQLQDVLPSLLELTPVETAVLDISSVKAPAPDSILVEAVNCDQVANSPSSSSIATNEKCSLENKSKDEPSSIAEMTELNAITFDDVGQLFSDPVKEYETKDLFIISGTLPEDEISLTVCFVHCHSPDSLFFQIPHHAKVYKELMVNLDHAYSNYKQKKELKFEVNFACVVHNYGDYFRAEVIDIDEYPRCKVRLMDLGQIIEVGVEDIFPLLAPFDQIPRLAIHCSLHGVYPPGGVWNTYVQKRITELLLTARDISICKRQPLHPSSPLSVMVVYEIKSKGDPLEPAGLKLINLNEQLVELKLALNQPDRTALSNRATPTWQESPVVKLLPQFNGVVTWVNLTGEVFLYDINKSEYQLKNMQKQLYSIYEGSQPTEADLKCKSGDPCIARYKLDGKWYRATILNTAGNRTKVEVFFVDYGTRDEVDRYDIRLNIMLESIPIQTIKCTIHNIKVPGTKTNDATEWPISTLDHLHQLIVDQTCRVIVHTQSPSANFVSLFLSSGTCVAEYLVDKKLAEFIQVKTKPDKPGR